MDVAKLLQRLKLVKSILKVDKTGIVHAELVGFFWAEQIVDNAHSIQTLIKLKPTAKGMYIKSIYLDKHYGSTIALDKASNC
jgi:ribosomal protein L1